MKFWTRIAFVMLFVPLVASAQFRDLDAAMSNLERGFGSGDVDAIVSGIGADEQVSCSSRGSIDKRRLLRPRSGRVSARRALQQGQADRLRARQRRGPRAEGQYHIKARWSIGGRRARPLHHAARRSDARWIVVSIRSAG